MGEEPEVYNRRNFVNSCKQEIMATTSPDIEFSKYWLKLSLKEKESLLSVARHYVELKEDTSHITIEQYNQEIDAAMKRMDKGEFYTHAQAVELSKRWLNG
jgi:hypothetical protein